MFIKSNRKKGSNKEYESHFLVESYRDKQDGQIRQKYLANLSALPLDMIMTLKQVIKGGTNENNCNLKDIEVIASKQYGNVAVFSKLYDKYFQNISKDNKINRAIKAIVINKIFDPKSKSGIKNWMKSVDIGFSITNKNDLYNALDVLEADQHTIEKKLAKKHLKTDGNIMLYDVTSTYFEGKGAAEICKYGYSRDHRSDRVQVNIGLITAKDGTPVSCEVIEGNISDKQTLQTQIKKIQERFGIKNLTFVFDRGMKSKVNLDYIKEHGYEYITALSHQELKEKAQKNKAIQLGIFDKENIAIFEIDGKSYCLCHNPMKAEKDSLSRGKLIDKTLESLGRIQNFKRSYKKEILQDKISKVINKYKCEKYIDYEILDSKITFAKKEELINRDALYDGFYMIESTDKEIIGKEALYQYKDLQLVERAFDSMKNHIQIRPVFHYKESRIKGHIFTCFMSYFLLHKFKQQAQDILKSHTLDDLLTELCAISKIFMRIGKIGFEKISNLSDIQKKLFGLFGVKCSA